MKQEIKHGNPIEKRARDWKDKQRIESSTFDNFIKILGKSEGAFQRKYDGALHLLRYEDGKVHLGTLKGRIVTDLPLTKEAEKILKKDKTISSCWIAGEIVAVKNNTPLSFPETMDIIRDPSPEQEKQIKYFPFEFIEINGKELPLAHEEGYYESFKKSYEKLAKLFKNAKYIQPAKTVWGKVDTFKKFYKDWVDKKHQEGIVARTPDNKIYKIKRRDTADCAVIGYDMGTGKFKGTIGALFVALMDKNKNYILTARVGSGYTDPERDDFYKKLSKSKADLKNPEELKGDYKNVILVKPEIVIEVEYHEPFIAERPVFKYSKGKYEIIDEVLGPTLREPRFKRIRDDKSATNQADLRLTQIPNYKELLEKYKKKKESYLISKFYKKFNALNF